MAEEMPAPQQHITRPEILFTLAVWLKKIQREERVNGDKRIQTECFADFESLSKEVDDLCHELEEFMRAIRPIGSSSGLISTSRVIRSCMDDVLGEFGSNSAEIWRDFSLGVGSIELPHKLKVASNPEIQLPERMRVLSERLEAFLEGLCDIPEFSDERLKNALLEFREWLLYRAECIALHRDSKLVKQSTVQKYISQVMKEMENYVSSVKDALSKFVQT
ncbi:hypothetical protein FRC00_007652, partial [Tulasnella sp. 408]